MHLAMHLDVSVALGTVFFFTPQALADTTSGVDTSTDPSPLLMHLKITQLML